MTCLPLNTFSCGFSLAAGLFQPPGLSSAVSSTAIQALGGLCAAEQWIGLGTWCGWRGEEKRLFFSWTYFPMGSPCSCRTVLQTTKGMIDGEKQLRKDEKDTNCLGWHFGNSASIKVKSQQYSSLKVFWYRSKISEPHYSNHWSTIKFILLGWSGVTILIIYFPTD